MSDEQTFESFGLSEPVRRALTEVGYESPTPVQLATFQTIAEGRDVIVQSRTGSGKTAAFALPLIDRVLKPTKCVQAMVLCPTRELALQVAGEFERLGKYSDVGVAAVYGGAGMQQQRIGRPTARAVRTRGATPTDEAADRAPRGVGIRRQDYYFA